MTPILFPAVSQPTGHRAVCVANPLNVSTPLYSGVYGLDANPYEVRDQSKDKRYSQILTVQGIK
jgi:hypothetical protein